MGIPIAEVLDVVAERDAVLNGLYLASTRLLDLTGQQRELSWKLEAQTGALLNGQLASRSPLAPDAFTDGADGWRELGRRMFLPMLIDDPNGAGPQLALVQAVHNDRLITDLLKLNREIALAAQEAERLQRQLEQAESGKEQLLGR